MKACARNDPFCSAAKKGAQMKKLIAELLILTMSAGLLAGCGAQSNTTVIPTAADATAETATAQSATGQMQGGQPGGNAGGMIDKSSDTELQSILAEVEDQFRQETYTDSQTGLSVAYNIYLPADYDASKTYPMVVFIPDSSTVGKDATAALEQGYGGVIWATQEEQAKHEAIVVAVEYPDVVLDDHNGYVTTDYVDLTPRLIQSITEKYSVDDNRIYGTGQSILNCKYTGEKKYIEEAPHDMEEFREIIAILREHCPWDKVQTFETLKETLVDETQEVLEAIDHQDAENLCEELGDVLLQIVMMSNIAQEQGLFTMDDVVQKISEKMIRRHPHVFGDVEAHTVEDLHAIWKQVKAREKAARQEKQ